MKNIQTIIFDLGGVLIDWNPRYVYKNIFKTNEAMEYFLKEICTDEWNITQDEGRSLQEGTKILVDKFPHYENEIAAFYGRWIEMLGGPIQPTVDILRQLKDNKYRLYALTNWSAETFPVALAKYEFLQWFDGILVSGTEKLKKPDSRIYELILERYHINRETALFIDDNPHNVEASNALGLPALRFVDADTLLRQLSGFGVFS